MSTHWSLRSALLLSCLALLPPQCVWAQGQWTTNERLALAAYEEVLFRNVVDPSLDSAVGSPLSGIVLEGGKDGDTKVKARLGFKMSPRVIGDLVISSPLNKSGQSTLVDLDGLSNLSTADLGFTWTFRLPDRPALDKAYNAMTRVPALAPMAAAPANTENVGDISYEALENTFYPQTSGAAGAAAATTPELSLKRPIFLTVRAKAGREDFSFVDAVTLAAGKESHTNDSFVAALGTSTPGLFYAAVSLSEGNAFSASRRAEVCSPFGGSGSLECRQVNLGPPTKSTTRVAELEVRRLLGRGLLGLGARVAHDLEADVTAVEVPIYFLRKPETVELKLSKMGEDRPELTGGISIRWRSDTEDFAATAFIGPSFGIFRFGGQ